MIIYKITHKLSGKSYIGQTTRTLKERVAQHLSDKQTNLYFHRALRKYGIQGFSVEEIAAYTNIEDLNNAEEYYIDFFDCLAPNGYNLMPGGNNKQHNNITKKKMSENQLGEKNSFYGKKHTKATKEKLAHSSSTRPIKESTKQKCRLAHLGKPKSEAHKINMSLCKLGKPSTFKGKHHTQEAKLKLSLAHKGKYFGNRYACATPIKCLNNGKIYASQRDAAKELGISFHSINKVLKDKMAAVKGYKFIYA